MHDASRAGEERRTRLAYALGAALLAASAIARILAYPVIVSDYTYFLAKWFDALAVHPWLTAFANPFADYAPLYLYLLKLLTLIPISSLISIKTLSLLFDIASALVIALLIKQTSGREHTRGQLFLIGAIFLSVPTILINSSLWGQSDAAYAFGIVLCFYFILRDRPLPAALAFALAFCFKVQSVFFLPILAGYYLRKSPRTLAYLLLIPGVYALSLVPAWQGGGSFAGLLATYAHQAGEYTGLSVSAQSAFAFANPLPLSAFVQGSLFWAGIALSAIAAIAIMIAIARGAGRSARALAYLSLLSVIVIPYLLPRMHERYFYLADVFSVIYAFYSPKEWYVPVLVVASSFLAYMPFLSGQVALFSSFHIDLRVPASILLALIIIMLAQIALPVLRRRQSFSG